MIELVNHVISSIKTIVAVAVKSLKSHVYKVSLDKPIEVTVPFPKTQKIEGKVSLAEQKSLEQKIVLFAQLVESKLNELSNEIKSIPRTVSVDNFPTLKEIKIPTPQFPSSMEIKNPVDKVTVSNLSELTKLLEKIASKEIILPEQEELTGSDPKKYVPVRLTDGKEFYEAISHIVGGMKRPQTIANIDPLGTFQISDEDSGGTTKYYGFVDQDERWYILKTTATAYRYAVGNGGYEAAWTARADQTYKYFHEVF